MTARPQVHVALILSVGAFGGAAGQAARVHPSPEYIARAAATTDIAFAAPERPIPFARSSVAIAVIGSLDADGPFVFGRIGSTDFLDDSTIAVLDPTANEVRLFTTSGRHVQTIGRAGSGPGEFRNPVLVVGTPKGEIIVSDLRRMLQFFKRGPRGFEYSRSLTMPFSVRSMCFLGSRLYINGADLETGTLIRAVDDSGRVTAAFGEIYKSPNTMVNYQIAEGRILCDEARGLVYYMPGSLLGEVRAFRPTGQLAWRVRVTDFLNNRVTDENGGTTVVRSPNGAHAAGSLAQLGPSALVAQWTFLTPEQMRARETASRIHSVLIDPETGKATSLGTALPLLKGRRGELVLEHAEDPAPRLTIRRYTAGR
jgi:hypothetical protein